MSQIIVRPVRGRRARRAFLTFPWRVYPEDPLWVPPILADRDRATDPNRGQFFQRGEAEFFIAWQDGRPVGTICAAEDPPTNRNRGTQECVFGFFDCLKDYPIAEALFDRAAQWARDRGLNQLFGPFNLD